MPHIPGNPFEGHKPDAANPGEFETLSPGGKWGPATESHTLSLLGIGGAGGTGGAVEGDFTFLLQSEDPNKPIVKTAPNGDLISIDPAELRAAALEGRRPKFTVIVEAVNGIPPLIRLDGNGNLIAIKDPSKPTEFEIIVPASTTPIPTSGDIKVVARVGLPSGQVVTYIAVGGELQSFVGSGPLDTSVPTITGTQKFPDGVTRVYFSNGTFRDAGPEKPLPTGFESLGEAVTAGQTAGIAEPKIWVDTSGRFHFDIPEDPAPSGTKIVSESVVGNETVYELENGQVIRQRTPEPIKPPEEVDIGGQPFAFNPNTGGFQQVQQPAREFEPDVVIRDGRAFIQQPDGSLTPLGREEVPNLDELINQRILSGDAQGALALADFRDRPTSLEAFNAAMQFAQSPGDVAAISAISRGQSLVEPPPSGTVQRIAEQPEFLQDAYQRLINQIRGGSGSPEEFIDVLTRINKERDEREAAQEATDEELAKEKETSRKLKLDALLAPLNQQISDLTKQIDQLSKVGAPAPVNAPTTSGVPDDTATATSGVGEPVAAQETFEETQERLFQQMLAGEITEQQASQLLSDSIASGFTAEFETALDGTPLRYGSRSTVFADATPATSASGLPSRMQVGIQAIIDEARREGFGGDQNSLIAFAKEAIRKAGAAGQISGGAIDSGAITMAAVLAIRGQVDRIGAPSLTRFGDDTASIQKAVDEQAATFVTQSQSALDPTITSETTPTPSLAQESFNPEAGRQFVDAFAQGGTAQGHNLEIVGEPGPDGKPNPELVDLPSGTRVTPISKLSAAKIKKLKEMGIIGMQEGGVVEPLLPFGVRRALAGVVIPPTKRRLSRAAGLPVLSAQARQNLLPEELEVFNRLSREAGIPEGAFRQEQESAFPGANLARGRARSAPRVLR